MENAKVILHGKAVNSLVVQTSMKLVEIARGGLLEPLINFCPADQAYNFIHEYSPDHFYRDREGKIDGVSYRQHRAKYWGMITLGNPTIQIGENGGNFKIARYKESNGSGLSTTAAATCCAILAGSVNALQAPSRRHPQSTMRQARIVAQECLAPMYVWERINVRRLDFLWRGSMLALLARRMSGIVYFLVFRQFGSSKPL
ncbi:hypothetical protein EDB19DRAFT_2027182 [Suillus lakei]|nr:hypothetical protein EDB19DRAFT_2027182 [Suillus lakei]